MPVQKKQTIDKNASPATQLKKKDPFEEAIDYLESLDEGCEKPTRQYSFDTCQTSGCAHPEHRPKRVNQKRFQKGSGEK
ncbi:hypothetical protein HY772_08415 [Candidatus Woesearchaeota archaeon]|nr:hypothetical protein [Candidatus Woesearchaeota archaeon]